MDNTERKSGNGDTTHNSSNAGEASQPQADSAVNVRIKNGRIVIESVRPDAETPARPRGREGAGEQ